jgi:DNA polymerase-1
MILCLDTEQTTWGKGDPFDERNSFVCFSYVIPGYARGVLWADERGKIAELVAKATTLVGWNLKRDLHWLKRIGVNFDKKRVFCCQLSEYLLSRQQHRYPDLDSAAFKYLNKNKLKIIEEEYWNKGINTDEIPRPILAEYALSDAELTLGVYLKQLELIPAHQKTLFSVYMQDLLVLQEMEWNGVHYNKELSEKRAQEIDDKIQKEKEQLNLFVTVPDFNWASNDHLSALLYGGRIKRKTHVPNGAYKTGDKKGQIKFSVEETVYHLPRLYKPIRGSELKKEGFWSVDESYLSLLTGDSKLIDGILAVKGLEKQNNTYYKGIPKRAFESHWKPSYIYGQYNQSVTATGRLSSSKPNLQNIEGNVKEILTTRW